MKGNGGIDESQYWYNSSSVLVSQFKIVLSGSPNTRMNIIDQERPMRSAIQVTISVENSSMRGVIALYASTNVSFKVAPPTLVRNQVCPSIATVDWQC